MSPASGDARTMEKDEIIAQTGPNSGFPQALNALDIADEVLD